MPQPSPAALFAGSIPELYDRHLVPLLFAPYASDLAARVALLEPTRVLETAAGTGAVTRELAQRLPPGCEIVATDLSQPMLERAAASGTVRPVEWRRADALELPFPKGAFDAVVCQFGVMFFPDRVKAFAEARRVLRRGGRLVFSVWDRLEHNELAAVVDEAIAPLFPDDPTRFISRLPHGYHDPAAVARDLSAAGFARPPERSTVDARSRASSPQLAAIALCQGTPLRGALERCGPSKLAEATETAAAALARRFGDGPIEGGLRAHVFAVEP